MLVLLEVLIKIEFVLGKDFSTPQNRPSKENLRKNPMGPTMGPAGRDPSIAPGFGRPVTEMDILKFKVWETWQGELGVGKTSQRWEPGTPKGGEIWRVKHRG